MGDNGQYYYEDQKAADHGAAAGASATGEGYGDGYGDAYGATGEAYTDPNVMGTDQTQQDYYDTQEHMAGVNSDAAEAGNADYYDPAQYQSYYYQDDDGNYYYYADPQAEAMAETQDNAGVAPTPENLVRSYEYEDWEPQNYNWFVNIVVDTFFSKPYRVYLTVVLCCGGVLLSVMGLNYSFAMLFRLYYPPVREKNMDIQAFSYLTMFLYLSFVMVSVICALMDMLRNLWWQEREDVVFWGFSHRYFSKQKPPYCVYLIIILVTVPLPLFWGVAEAATSGQSLLFFAQRYANVVVIVGAFLVLTCFVWFYWRALVYKSSAISKAKERDDYRQRDKAFKNRPEKMHKTHWYHAQTVLEEFGMDLKTLRYNSVVFTVGLVPLFALYAAQALSTYTGDPSVVWGAISSLAIMCIYVIAWLSLLRRKAQWAVYCSFALDALFAVIGVVGAGMGGEPRTVAVVLVLFLACQGMVTRKRKHSLTRKELCVTLEIPLNREMEATREKRRFDSYLFCCRDLVLDYLRCFDVKTYFGYRHPDVVEAERRYAIDKIALRTDQKVLLVWWLVVMFAVAFVIALGNAVQYKYTSTIAVTGVSSPTGDNPASWLCEATFNRDGSAPLKIFDLALLSALSYSFGASGNTDFATWFSKSPTIQRRHPSHLPPTLNYATNGIDVRFSDYVDTSSDFHFITLNSNSRGLSLFRNIDEWGESIALQVAGAIAPLISIWPERYRQAFVQEAGFLKRWFPASSALNNVQAYLDNLIASGLQDSILLIGDQFNGGYAKLLSAQYGLPFVAFNPPGAKNMVPFLANGTQLSSVRGLWSYIDSLEDTAETLYMPCEQTLSANRCGRISTTIDYILSVCGDAQGRTYTGI